jgi:hypothetical protein
MVAVFPPAPTIAEIDGAPTIVEAGHGALNSIPILGGIGTALPAVAVVFVAPVV